MSKNKISKTFFFLLFLLYQNILNFHIYFKSKHFHNSIPKENTLIRLQWGGRPPSPFWCPCQKPLCPFAYFNKTLLHTHTHTHKLHTLIKGNANQNHNEISPHTCQNGYFWKNQHIINVGKDGERREPSYTIHGNINWSSHYSKQYNFSLKN